MQKKSYKLWQILINMYHIFCVLTSQLHTCGEDKAVKYIKGDKT